jgi:hypothetical protein
MPHQKSGCQSDSPAGTINKAMMAPFSSQFRIDLNAIVRIVRAILLEQNCELAVQ